MIFTQHYVDCLSQASYVIGDETTGKAVVVDPRRDIQDYLDEAAERGLTVVGVINTHFHADFLSGHLELAQATGAWVGYGEAATTDFPSRPLADGERISLGEVTLRVMATPGHTPESISVLVFEHADDEVPYGVLTGDTLFIGDVGRPDLLASLGWTSEQLGAALYDSVQHRLMALDDAVRVFPAHGAGSACGKNLSTEKHSTIGQQRLVNYACQPMTERQFLDIVTADQPAAPAYFVYDATLNRQNREVRETGATIPALDDEAVDAALAAGAVLVDTRDPEAFGAGHLSGAINLGREGRLAETAGMVLSPDDEVVLLSPGDAQEDALRFARIGFDHVIGYVADPETYLLSHADRVAPASRLTAAELTERLEATDLQLVDVRNPGEIAAGMIEGARSIPLAQLPSRLGELDLDRPVVVYCAGGWRSSVAASLLRHAGGTDVSDLLGGYGAWDRGRLQPA